jgi:hypothetical protein
MTPALDPVTVVLPSVDPFRERGHTVTVLADGDLTQAARPLISRRVRRQR